MGISAELLRAIKVNWDPGSQVIESHNGLYWKDLKPPSVPTPCPWQGHLPLDPVRGVGGFGVPQCGLNMVSQGQGSPAGQGRAGAEHQTSPLLTVLPQLPADAAIAHQ